MSTIKSSAEDLTLNADGSGNDVLIQSNASTNVIVTAEGTVGIGTTSPTVVDAGAAGLHLHGDSNATNRAQLHLTSATTGASGTDGMYILYDGVTPQIQVREDQPLVFWLNGSERMRVLAAGGLTFNGDTAAANALDDYEEGTFTPTVGDADNMTQQLGIYTKVGNLVSVFIKMQCAMSSGTCWVSGLPFAAQNTDNHYSTGSFFGVVGVEDFGDGSIAPQIAPNGTEVQLYVQDNGSSANYDSFGAGHVGSTVNFSLNITYAT